MVSIYIWYGIILSDVKWATLEPNGQLGFELKHEAQPVTKKEFEDFKHTIV
ncbi:YetF domain-containing protein [Neobacillus drentensis]|uniref:YetF domain-containing protein n=1 Tax=Neobacillus drentensis TaxID=220684 RepID=UPI002FFF6B92